jgi:ligand-binding sensor domain-containing protein
LFFIPEVLAGLTIFDLEYADEALWIATEDGLFRFNPKTKKLQRFQDPTMILFGAVYDIYLHKTELWFAANDGLLRLDFKSGETEAFNDLKANRSIRSVAANDRIVAYGSDEGLKIIKLNEKRKRLIELTRRDGLASNNIYTLLFEGEYLWIGSDRGLTRLWWKDQNFLY